MASTAVRKNMLMMLPTDCWLLSLSYLDQRETSSLGRTCKRVFDSLKDDRLWCIYCSGNIKGLEGRSAVEKIKSIGYTSYHALYVSLRYLDFNIVGSFRLVPEGEEPTGGLYKRYDDISAFYTQEVRQKVTIFKAVIFSILLDTAPAHK